MLLQNLNFDILYWRVLLLFFMGLELQRFCCNKNKGNTLVLFEIHIDVYAIFLNNYS